jgi:hypothetical protein
VAVASKWVTVCGLAGPFGVAGLGVVYTHYVGTAGYDIAIPWIMCAGLSCAPAIAGGLFCRLPRGWSEGPRLAAAILLAIPVACLEVFAALYLFVVATIAYLE